MNDKYLMLKRLYEVIVSIDNVDDCAKFIDDLCTRKEAEQMAQRVRAAELLIDGKTYAQVMAETEISSATLSRVSRCVQYGDGYKIVLKK